MKGNHLFLKVMILFVFLFLFSTPSLALIPGDFGSADNGPPDGCVDFEDLMIFALAYGSVPTDANWNPDCDIAGPGSATPDDKIDFEDLMIFAMHYGECAPPSPPILSDPGTTLPSPASYTVSWLAVSGATSYVLQEATSSDFSGAISYTVSSTSKSFSHTVSTTTTYYYRVAVVDSCGQSGWSNVENIIINCCAPPSAPTLSDPGTTLPSPATYTVSWTPVTGVKSYILQEDKSSSFSGAKEYTLGDTSKEFSHTVSTNTTYYYRVAAVNSCGQSDWSNVEDIIVNCCTLPSPPILSDPGTTLPAPANYTVSWTAVSEATSYVLQEATSSSFSGATSHPVTGTSKSFSHTVITTYYYRVAAINDCGQSSWSNIVDIQICPCTPPSPPTLSDPGDTLTSPANYTVSWTAVSEATSYVLQEATSSSFSGAQEYTLSSTSKDFFHTVTTTTYYYRVAAVDYCGPSGWSNVENITVVTGPVHNLTKDIYYTTIQAALNAAATGDTIEVPDGTYDESITFPSAKKITLQSVNGPSSTIIRGNDDSTTVDFQNSLEDTTLEGFTITHNSGENGRGIYISEGFLIIDNCTISGNTAGYGGGIRNTSGTLTITSSTISGNVATASWGGGIYNDEGTSTITSSTISGNTAGYGGGIMNSYGTLTITSSDISGNDVSTDGGGIYNNGGTLNITSSSTISNNTASWGGGIKNYHGTLTITSSTISGNDVSAKGGGIYNYDASSLTITSSTISGNTAAYGGGISNILATLNITSSSIISGNTAGYGGGINNRGGTLTITSSIITGNDVSTDGGGIYTSSGTITIGGYHYLDFNNFNAFTFNKKNGRISADQHIRDSIGDCHLSYPNNNYNPK